MAINKGKHPQKENIFTTSALMLCKRGRRYYGIAYELLCLAAKDGNAEAQYAIGTWLLYGRHVKKDPRKAFVFLKKAAKNGSAEAMFDLAVSFEKGIGVRKSSREAFRWYLSSAKHGYGESCKEVARCYYYGIGVKGSHHMYHIWNKKR